MDSTQKTVTAPVAGKTALIIPTLNAGRYLEQLIPLILALDPSPNEVVVIDSSSNDNTLEQAQAAGFRTHRIDRKDFDHGETRNIGAALVPDADFLIFMTQDAQPANSSLVKELLAPFEDPEVALVFAQQLPHANASISARFSRQHRYPSTSFRRTLEDTQRLGAMAAFCSNACAAYRRDNFEAVGRFPVGFPLGEDMSIAARFLQAGLAIVYAAPAQVFHSHEYNWIQEFSRYFDIGTHHRMDPWLCQEEIKVSNEGLAYVLAETRYTWQFGHAADLVSIIPRLGARWMGFKIGHHLGSRLPPRLTKLLSMHRFSFNRDTKCDI
jgi:rhamnosyltransferase